MADLEASSRPTGTRSAPVPPMPLHRHLFSYLVVGGLTVLVDLGLLSLLHELYGVSLGVATTVAYYAAVLVNFWLNRTLMSSGGSRGLTQHAVRYASLVLANYVITLAVVTAAGHVGDRYLIAKVAVVAVSTGWNFLLYRYWIFTPPRPTSPDRARVPWSRRDPDERADRSVPPGDRVLSVVPVSSGGGPVGSPGRPPGDSGASREQDPGHEHRV